MNNIVLIVAVLNLLRISFTKNMTFNCNMIKLSIRNKALRYIIFKDTTILYFLRNCKNYTVNCYNKAIVSVSQGIEKYNSLSDEDKIIIDTICDLFL